MEENHVFMDRVNRPTNPSCRVSISSYIMLARFSSPSFPINLPQRRTQNPISPPSNRGPSTLHCSSRRAAEMVVKSGGVGGAEEGAAGAAVRRWVEAGGGRLVLDGGLATELEAHGADLNDPLWSAKCILSSPHLIRQVHLDYIEAGANIIITASYQATIQGFESKGFAKEQSENLLTKSVEIAHEAREMFLKQHSDQLTPIHRPILVAASIGSYGAYLADGSEYSGDYGEAGTLEFLKDFHRRRLQVLAEACPDLIAFETIPNKLEAQAYVELLEECNINIPSWFSFNSKDGVHVVSGDSLIECATIANACARVGAVGINCTPPRFIHSLILTIRKVTNKPILIYPNSGERYDAEKKEWVESTGVSDGDFVSYVSEWCKDGAALIGGCCRTTPNTIRAITRTLNQFCPAP